MLRQHNTTTFAAPITFSLLITFGLFYAMVLMTKSPDLMLNDIQTRDFEFFTPREIAPPTVKTHKPVPLLPEDAPEIPRPTPPLTSNHTNTGLIIPRHAPSNPASAPEGFNSGPMPIVAVSPQYPPHMLRAGVEGEVLLEFSINTAGGVDDIRVLQSQPAGAFDKAAIRALRKFRFQPMTIDGRPQSTHHIKRNFIFKLPEQS